MADLPIWRAIAAIQDIQRLRREQPGTVLPEIDDLAAVLRDALRAHAESVQQDVERALASAPDDGVRARLDTAIGELTRVADGVDYALTRLREDDDRQLACEHLEWLLETQFSGAAIRTRENPFALVAPVEASPELPSPATPPLRSTEEIHPSVAAQAQALGNDPRRLYAFVAGSIAFAPYHGHFRAPTDVLADGVGNDADMAGLLVELLRVSGIPARLVFGGIRLTEEVAAQWLDVRDLATVETLLRDAGFTTFASTSEDVRTIDILEHYRVRAQLDLGDGPAWIELDPSMQAWEIDAPGRSVWTALPWTTGEGSLEFEYFADADAVDGPLAFYEQRLRDAVEIELRVRRRAAVDPEAVFPPPLPYTLVGFAREQDSFTPADEHVIALTLVGPGAQLLEYRFATPARFRDRITLRYAPATPVAEALLASAAGPLAAPSFAVDLRPRLEIEHADGRTTIIDSAAFAPAGTPLYLAIALEHPSPRIRRRSEARPLCGTEWTFAVEGPGALLDGTLPATSITESPLMLVPGARSLREYAPPVLRAYHRRLARAASRIAALTDAVGASGTLITMAAASLETIAIGGIPFRQRPASFLLDVRSIELHLYDSGGASLSPFLELFFAEGSHHEARVLRDHLGLRSLSTVAALREADPESNPLRVVRAETSADVDLLDHPERVKNALRVALGITGRESVTISQRPVAFGDRELSAWIARGGSEPSSDYAIAGLNGGYGNDEKPKPNRPHVELFPCDEFPATMGHRVGLGAMAWDDEFNDLTDAIEWSAPGLEGSGAGGDGMYFPTKPGRYTVVTRVGGGGSPSAGLEDVGEGGASDSTTIVVWDAIIEKLVFDKSPELIRVRDGSKPLGKVHYAPDQEPSPAVLVADISTTATMKLKVQPMTANWTLVIVIEGSAEDKDGELVTLQGMVELKGPFEGDVPLEVKVANRIGVVTQIQWKFSLWGEPVEKETKVRMFVAGARPDKVPKHALFEEIYAWSCDWARGKTPADHDGILTALMAKRGLANLQFSYDPKDSATRYVEFLRVRPGKKFGMGQCGEVAKWFLALASVHGIDGKILWWGILRRDEPDEAIIRWQSMLITKLGLNNLTHDGIVHLRNFKFVKPGEYVTDKITTGTIHESTDFLKQEDVWEFKKHQMDLFMIGGKPHVYDCAMEIGSTFVLDLPIKDQVLPATPGVFRDYISSSVAYFIGQFGNDMIVVSEGDIRHEQEDLFIHMHTEEWPGP